MVWKEVEDHITDCYFFMTNLKGINHKNQHNVQYSDFPSATRPILQIRDLPVLEPAGNMEYSSDSERSDITVVSGGDAYKLEEDDQPLPLIQAEPNDLTRDRNLSKESAQLLGTRLKEKHLLEPRTTFYSKQ